MSEEGGESGGSRAVAIAAKIFLSLKTLATPSGQTQSTNSIRIFPFMTLTAGRGIRVSTYPSHTILAYVIKSGWPHVLLLTRVTRPLTFPFFSVLSSLFFSFFFFNLPTTTVFSKRLLLLVLRARSISWEIREIINHCIRSQSFSEITRHSNPFVKNNINDFMILPLFRVPCFLWERRKWNGTTDSWKVTGRFRTICLFRNTVRFDVYRTKIFMQNYLLTWHY